jgi:hypothetical protein
MSVEISGATVRVQNSDGGFGEATPIGTSANLDGKPGQGVDNLVAGNDPGAMKKADEIAALHFGQSMGAIVDANPSYGAGDLSGDITGGRSFGITNWDAAPELKLTGPKKNWGYTPPDEK